MFTSKYRWMAAFGTSIACHVVVFVVIGVVVALFPSAPVDKGPIEVDLVSLSGGGGGGGGSPDADNGPAIAPPSAEPTEVAPPPPALAEDMPEDAMNDVHEIADSVTESKEAATKDNMGKQVSGEGESSGNRGFGSGTGSGGGHGSGHGTGTGSSTGSGSGTGSGGGNGSGAGTGNGDGNDGITMGPQILSAPSPSYPESARASNVEGTTVVGLIISVNGNVTSAWVESSSGNSILDQTAVNAVYGWQFVPAKQNGVAVEAQSRVPVSFTLK